MIKLMRIFAALLTILFITLPDFQALAAFTPGQWTNYCQVETGDTSKGYALTEITGSLYQMASPDFRDIRVVQTAGADVQEVQNDIVSLSTLPRTTKLDTAMMNRGISAGKSTATVDLGTKVLHNSLEINTASRDFIKEVSVEGSDDRVTWVKVRNSGKIADFNSPGQVFRQTKVSYDPVDYRYLRMTLFGGSGKAVEIEGIEILFKDNKAGTEKAFDMTTVSQGLSEKDNNSEIVITSGFNNFPVHSLEFAVDQNNFSRAASLYGSNDNKNWEQVGEGRLASFNLAGYMESQLSLEVNNPGFRYLKVVINNGDSPALKVLSVKGRYFPKYILFPCKAGEQYRVYLGNPSANAPRYDLAAFSNRIVSTNPPVWNLSSPQTNPDYTPPATPESEKHKWLLPAILTLLVAGLAVFIIKLVPKVMKGE